MCLPLDPLGLIECGEVLHQWIRSRGSWLVPTVSMITMPLGLSTIFSIFMSPSPVPVLWPTATSSLTRGCLRFQGRFTLWDLLPLILLDRPDLLASVEICSLGRHRRRRRFQLAPSVKLEQSIWQKGLRPVKPERIPLALLNLPQERLSQGSATNVGITKTTGETANHDRSQLDCHPTRLHCPPSIQIPQRRCRHQDCWGLIKRTNIFNILYISIYSYIIYYKF